MNRPLIIITDQDNREQLLAEIISKHGQSLYAIVLRSVTNVENASRKLGAICSKQGVKLLAHGDDRNIKFCDGIHLNVKSKTIKEVRRIYGAQITIGYSSHSAAEAKQALSDGADYVFLSPVFRSKDGLSSPMGVEAFNLAVTEVGRGVFALGGVDSINVNAISKKASGFACISSIFNAENPNAEVGKLIQHFC